MPHRRPKPSIVLGAVAAFAVASPFAAFSLDNANSNAKTVETRNVAIPTKIAQVVLANVPDIVIPLKELTGLNVPDLHLADLKKLPIPAQISVPSNLPIPPGLLPENLQIPDLNALAALAGVAAPEPLPTDPAAPIAADELPPEVAGQVGTTVKELTRDTPFSMIALTAKTLESSDAKVRVKLPTGDWGPWLSTEQIDTRRTDKSPAGGKSGTEPIYVGQTNAVQLLVTKKQVAAPVPGPAAPAPAPAPAAAVPSAPLGYAPASLSSPMRQEDPAATDDLAAVLIEPGTSTDDDKLSDIASPLSNGGPKVITRAQWGADESIRCQEPTYDDHIGGATVHHSAGNNDYSKAESAGIVRAIYAYHAQTLDWCDIGYNALVDKYGQIFEGRFGGLDKAVQGAHAGGFNENTVGVTMMGNFEDVAPPQVTLDSVGKFLAWRLKLANLDPKGTTEMYSEGTEFTPYAEGEKVELPVIFAHLDVGNTECPGKAAYAKMDEIRDIAAKNLNGSLDSLAVAPGGEPADPGLPSSPASSDAPVAPGLPGLVEQLVRLTDQNPIALKWVAEGGDTGKLGPALSGLLPAKNGAQYAKFVNGYIYSAPGGKVTAVVGKILEQFLQMGLDSGALGLPTSDEIPVPEGMKADFENGSLIFNQVTGFVTTLLKTYNNAYDEAYNNPQDASAPLLAPAPAPAG